MSVRLEIGALTWGVPCQWSENIGFRVHHAYASVYAYAYAYIYLSNARRSRVSATALASW